MASRFLLLAVGASAIALPPPQINIGSLFTHTTRPPLRQSLVDDTPLPVILWHGLGDASNAEGLADVADLIDSIHPGTYVHLITPTNAPDDRSASFFGNLTSQIETVCDTLANDPILATAPAVDALGFSQGGQFLRAYVERCNTPPVRSLITFGSQHNGISEFQRCKSATDFVCHAANALLKSSTVWSNYVQSHLVPAQYYRDPEDYENYLTYSNFLADINNEREQKNQTYKKNLAKLDNFVMVVFEDDTTVIPKESGWFAEVNGTTGEVTDLQNRTIYKEDWIGLKKLDAKGSLHFETVEGEHMRLRDKDLKKLFKKHFGAVKEKQHRVYGVADF